eukprot:COSAG03_NODE_9211_length_738_cov_0.784038_1_plen_110_part_01
MPPGGAGSQLICITDCPIPLLHCCFYTLPLNFHNRSTHNPNILELQRAEVQRLLKLERIARRARVLPTEFELQQHPVYLPLDFLIIFCNRAVGSCDRSILLLGFLSGIAV